MSKMSQKSKILGISACIVTLMAIFTFLFKVKETKDRARQLNISNIAEKYAELKSENKLLMAKITGIEKQNMR